MGILIPVLAAVCFTPGQYCEGRILKLIYSAKHSIRVQAYSFTSHKIANALVKMEKRGVDVAVILDKSQFQCQQYSQQDFLFKHHVPIYEDYRKNIAHNKVIIVDGETVETGSYNYTISAQRYNAENVLILRNKKLSDQYINNWRQRRKQSVRISQHWCTNDLANKPIP